MKRLAFLTLDERGDDLGRRALRRHQPVADAELDVVAQLGGQLRQFLVEVDPEDIGVVGVVSLEGVSLPRRPMLGIYLASGPRAIVTRVSDGEPAARARASCWRAPRASRPGRPVVP